MLLLFLFLFFRIPFSAFFNLAFIIEFLIFDLFWIFKFEFLKPIFPELKVCRRIEF